MPTTTGATHSTISDQLRQLQLAASLFMQNLLNCPYAFWLRGWPASLLLIACLCGGGRLFAQASQAPQPKPNATKPAPKPALARLTDRVILISIGGLRGECLNNPATCQWPLLTLNALAKQGATVQTIESVYPTQSLPAHASLLTGMLPVDHGISSAASFNPATAQLDEISQHNNERLKNPPLWQTLTAAKLTFATVNFPLTPDAAAQGFYWLQPDLTTLALERVGEKAAKKRPAPKELLALHITRDQQVMLKALDLATQTKPNLLLLHFSAFDFAQQQFGPNSRESLATLQTLDGFIQRLTNALPLATIPQALPQNRATLMIVSTHGSTPVQQTAHLNVELLKKGWLKADEQGKITEWHAFAQSLGGAAAVFIKNQKDEKDIETLFRALHDKPDSPIWRVVPRREAAQLGADPQVALFLDAAPGYEFGDNLRGPYITKAEHRATAGQLPQRAEMRTAWLAVGQGIRPGTTLPYARLIDLAPTIIRLFGLELRPTRGRVLTETLQIPATALSPQANTTKP